MQGYNSICDSNCPPPLASAGGAFSVSTTEQLQTCFTKREGFRDTGVEFSNTKCTKVQMRKCAHPLILHDTGVTAVRMGVTYHFARLNLITAHRNKNQVIREALQSKAQICQRGFYWGFVDSSEIQREGRTFLSGTLVKYRLLEAEVVDKELRTVTTTDIDDGVVAKSPFFLDVETNVIAFRPISGQLSANQFMKNFAELIAEAHDRLFIDADVQAITEEHKILEIIKELKHIHKIVIELHPSNPSNRERWKRTDERLQDMRAECYRETYSGNDLRIHPDSEVYGNIIMAGDGYGRARVEGKKDGKPIVASTHKLPVTASVADHSDPQGVLGALLEKFREIWGRVVKS